MNYIALIGDIVSSKLLSERRHVQERLRGVLETLNTDNPSLASRYTITLGDEFQAVFKTADRIFYDSLEILAAVYPVRIRFSVGVGEILTDINYAQAIGMDGPAFYHARQGVDELKSSACLYNLVGINTQSARLLKIALCMFSHVSRTWKLNRLQILSLLCKQHSVQEIAASLRISDKAVYKNISAGDLETIKALLAAAATLVNEGLQ
jgi:hypothetical protein